MEKGRTGINMNEVDMGDIRDPWPPARKWVWPLGVVLVLVVGTAIALIVTLSVQEETESTTTLSPEPATAIEAAVDECAPAAVRSTYDRHVMVGDEGRTLIIETEGEEEEGVDVFQAFCILYELDISDAALNRVNATRAMDGTIGGSWEGYSATWTYHPKHGLKMIIEEAS